MTRPVCSTV